MPETTQFKPGQSGNPAGRPVGSRNKTAAALDALFEGAADDIAKQAIAKAKAGDVPLIRALLDRVSPPRKDRHIPFELPPMNSPVDAVKAAAAIAQGVAEGELTPSEAADLSTFVGNYVKAIEVNEIEARIRKLEEGAAGK